MGSYKFSKEYKVSTYDVDFKGELMLRRLVDFFNNTSSEQSEKVGNGFNTLYKKNLTFVIVKLSIDIFRYPKAHEDIKITTYSSGHKSYFTGRYFEGYDENNELFAKGEFIYFLIDLKKRTPVKFTDEMGLMYSDEINHEIAPTKDMQIKIPNSLKTQSFYKVLASHLDNNLHVTNGEYITFCEDSTDFEILKTTRVSKINLIFEKEILLNENIIVNTYYDNLEDQNINNNKKTNHYYQILDENGKSRCKLHFIRELI